MITEKENVFTCDCGFSWSRGFSGTHDCETRLRQKLAKLTSDLEQLQNDQKPIYIGFDFASQPQNANYQEAIDLLRRGAASELDEGHRAHHNALIFAANVLENAQAFGGNRG
jgi:hypothetical protein